MRCNLCRSETFAPVIDLGRMPIAHRLPAEPGEPVDTYPFEVVLCDRCGLVQIADPIPPAELYVDFNYCFSGWKPQPHIADELDLIVARRPGGRMIEIGSNDGLFLREAAARGFHEPVGVESNRPTTEIARAAGFTIYNAFLDEELAARIASERGRFDVLVCRQVLEHLPDIAGFFDCVEQLLDTGGVLFLDVPDVSRGFAVGDCSVLWEEHVSYFTRPSLQSVLQRFGYGDLDWRWFDYSGGTIAVLAERAAAGATREAIDLGAERELALGFAQRVRAYGAALRRRLEEARARGVRIVLYGVGNRACAITNILPLSGLIDYAVDDQVERQGRVMPGARLRIHPAARIAEDDGPLLVLLAVNVENEAAVSARVRALTAGPVETLSMLSPHDIMAELDALSLPGSTRR